MALGEFLMISWDAPLPDKVKGITYKASSDCDSSCGHYYWEWAGNPMYIPFKDKASKFPLAVNFAMIHPNLSS